MTTNEVDIEELPLKYLYPFFLVHVGAFGGSGFWLAYGEPDSSVLFLYFHGGFAILVYLIFYLAIFGQDEVKWMFTNAALGLFGIIAEMSLIMDFFGASFSDFPFYVHVIPFGYYVLYTFLIRQGFIDWFGGRDDPVRRRLANRTYVTGSLVLYGLLFLLT